MDTSLAPPRVVETDRSVVEAELSRLLREKRFSAAPQMSAFLRYIVSQTLDGRGERIKAYTVGVDALGKPHTFDAQSDPSVRVLALRLRKTLVAIYESDKKCHAQIELRTGTYVPEFFKVDTPTKKHIKAVPTPMLEKQAPAAREPVNRDSASLSTTVPAQVELECTDTAQTRTKAWVNPLSGLHGVVPTPLRSDVALANNPLKRWLLLSFLFVFLCFCLLVGARGTGYMQQLSAGMSPPLAVSNAQQPAAVSLLPVEQQTPTLYLIDDGRHSDHLRQVSVLLGSSVVQGGSINVVRASPVVEPMTSTHGVYHIVLNELQVESHARIEAQIVRSRTGAVVMSATLMFDKTTAGFSGEEVRRVERLASGISDASGPIFRDFCSRYDTVVPAGCRYNQVTDPTDTHTESDAA